MVEIAKDYVFEGPGGPVKLVDLFDSLPEGEGTLLDNTATTWINEFSDGGAMTIGDQ